ncbi:Cadherin 96Ca [Carabus blaptoides fortunei]
MELLSTNEGPNAQLIGVLVAVMVSVCIVLAFVGCACCQRRRGFKEFRDSPVTASVVNDSTLSVTGDDPGHVNPIASSEFTIFTPLSPPHHNNNVFRTHHQPVISYIQNEHVPETQNKLNNTQIDGLDVSSWFDGSQSDFPRTKLKYIRELGSGWFGRVVEGEAQGINNNQDDAWTPVAVRILESSASAHEQALFLHEAAIYRIEQPHQHVLKLWGRSLEATPLLLIQEFCPRGDLKKFLLENQSCSTSPVMLGLPLQFCCQLASALQYLHDNNIAHLDLAARTCQITSDMSLKLGDYGLAVSQYARDYYQGTPAIPVRWCAPESLNYTNTTLQPKQVTLVGNIWSLGVTMWEICEWGTQPYDWLTDDEVVSQVMGPPHTRLPQPALSVYYIHPLYRLMQLCWQNSESRPLIPQIYAMLVHLMQTYQQDNTSKSPSKIPEFSVEDFDSRWDTLKPNTIVKTDNHISSDLKLTTELTSLSSTSEVYINPSLVRKSDSLTNLHGSFENLTDDADVETPVQNMDSWLQNVASHTGDMQYVRGLSQAIQALDSALALEQTSSSGSSYQHSPAPEHWDTRTPPTKAQQPQIEFKLGLTHKSSPNDTTNLIDSIFLTRRSESGSETEDETWRKRIERGAYSEKVRQKSKSVADLMVLTHIDCSDTDSETPQQSLEYKVNKNARLVAKNSLESSNLMFGSEGNLLAVQDTFQEELRKLQEVRRDSLLFVPARQSSDNIGSLPADIDQCISMNDCDNILDLNDITLPESFVVSDIVYSTPEKMSHSQITELSNNMEHSAPVIKTQTSSVLTQMSNQKLVQPSDIVSPVQVSDCFNINQKLIDSEKSSELLNTLPKLELSEKLTCQNESTPFVDVEDLKYAKTDISKPNIIPDLKLNQEESENSIISDKDLAKYDASYFGLETQKIPQSDRQTDIILTDPISVGIDLNVSDRSSQSKENRVDIFEGVSDDSIIPDTSLLSSSLTDIDQHLPDSVESEMKPDTVELVESIIGPVPAMQSFDVSRTADFLRNEQESEDLKRRSELENVNIKEGCAVGEENLELSLTDSKSQEIVDVFDENSQITINTHKQSVSPVKEIVEESKINLSEEIHKGELLTFAKDTEELVISEQDSKLKDATIISAIKETENSGPQDNFVHTEEETSMASNILPSSRDLIENIPKQTIAAQIEEFLQNEQLFGSSHPAVMPKSDPSNENISVLDPNVEEQNELAQELIEKHDLHEITKPVDAESSETNASSIELSPNKENVVPSDDEKIETVEQFLNKTSENNKTVESERHNIDQSKEPIMLEDSQHMEQSIDIPLNKEPSSYLQDQNLLEITSEVEIQLPESSTDSDSSDRQLVDVPVEFEVISDHLEEKEEATNDIDVTALPLDVVLVTENAKFDLDFTNLPIEIIQPKLSEYENQSITDEPQNETETILQQSEQNTETHDTDPGSFKNIVESLPDINNKIITSQFLYTEQEFANSQPENISTVITISKVEPKISSMKEIVTDIDESIVDVCEDESSSNIVTAIAESQQQDEKDTALDIDTINKSEITMVTTIPESQNDISTMVLPSATDVDNVSIDSNEASIVTNVVPEIESHVESQPETVITNVIASAKNRPYLRRIPTIIIEDVECDTADPVVDYETLISCVNDNDKQVTSTVEHDDIRPAIPNVQSVEKIIDKNVIQTFIENEIAASVVPVNTNTLINKQIKDIINKDAIKSSSDCGENANDVKLDNEKMTIQDSGVINECNKLETAVNEYAISTIREGKQLDESCSEQKLNDVESPETRHDSNTEAFNVKANSKEDNVEDTLINILENNENSDREKSSDPLLFETINDGQNKSEKVPEFSDEIDQISDEPSSENRTDDSSEKLKQTEETIRQTLETINDNNIHRPEVETNVTVFDNQSKSLDIKSDEEDRYSESDILSALENEDELCFKETDKSAQNVDEINLNRKQDDDRKAQFSLIQNFINVERNFGSRQVDFIPSIREPKLELVKDESAGNKDSEVTNVPQDTATNVLDLDTLNEPSIVHQMNQVYNVFSVTVDHRPPMQCFTSPVKNLYNKVFDQHDLITDINDLLLENDRKLIEHKSPEKLISDLSSVCTSSLPNEQLLNVLNNPPLVNGFDNEIRDKFIVDGTNIDRILEDCVTPLKTKLNYDISKTPAPLTELNVTKTLSEIISPASNNKETTFDEVRQEQVTDLDDSDDSFTQNSNEIVTDNTMNGLITSTPFTKKFIPPSNADDSKDNIFSFVSEGDELNNDFQTTVILGPCEDYTLGLYSGLKTTFENYANDDRPEEELLQFSSNFMPFDEDKAALKISQVNDKYFENNRTFDMNQSVDYSLETWDRFLGKSLLDQQNSSVFNNFSTKPESIDVFRNKENKPTEVTTADDEKPKQLDSTYNCNETSPTETFILDKTYDKNVVKGNSSEQVLSSNWEPGEGWFLHPQVPPEDLTGQIDISTSDNVNNSYVGFTLDEECVNALRNELAAKLPHAQGMTHEEQDDWDAEERSEIIVKYNVYATPLSPIPEESFCDDAYSDQLHNRDGSDSDSDWSEPCMGRTSPLEDILVVDTETHTALILESPSLREPQHRHTPSQDSCCSNDTLFNLEDLNYGPTDADQSPHHHGLTAQSSQSSDQEDLILQIEVTDNETLKLSLSNEDDEEDVELPSQKEDDEQLDLTISSDSVEDINITYTKPQINIDIADGKSLREHEPSSENSDKEELAASILVTETTEAKSSEDNASDSKNLHKLELKLEPGAFGVAPLPSPEDIPWRQLPASLLTYNEVVQNDKFDIQQESDNAQSEELDAANDDESADIVPDRSTGADNTKLEEDLSDSVREDVLDTDLYSNLTDIRFSGPCDTQLMSTSFSESADYAEERDWDSGSDTRSSSSGEFIWKEGEHEESLRALHAATHDVGVTEDLNPMDAIEEENSDSSNDDSDDDDDDCDEDIEETEFVPSAWDAQATPTKSALRSPEKSNKCKNQQKGVWFKKQKYHCVYEYPREPESPVAPSTDLWRPLSDFSNFTDWELDPESCVPPFEDQATTECREGDYDTVLDKYISRTNYPLASGSARHRDLYQLNPFPDFATGITGTDEDFFISSSARPFQTLGQGSQFFPGQDTKSKAPWQEYQSSSSQTSKDYSDNITPDSGVEDVTPASISDITLSQQLVQLSPPKMKVQTLKHLAAIAANKTAPNDTKVQDSLGGLRHTRNRLKLDLPPSPNSFTSNRTFTIDVPDDPVVNREVPTFTTFGKSRFSVQHVQTPTEDIESTATGIQTKNNADRNGKHKPVEMVQGEASLLDSADEDSGIESSANATLERHHQQVFH